jgi:endoglucanase
MKNFTAIILLVLVCQTSFCQGLRASGKKIIDKNGNEVILRGIGLGGWMLQEPYMLQLSGIASTQLDIKRKIKELAGDENTEKFYDAWLKNHCTKADIDSLASWGFNSVRLPMHYNLFTLPAEEEPVKGKQTWLEKGFELTDSLLSWCRANRIYLVLDLHAAPGGQGNDNAISDRDTSKPSLWQSELNKQKTIALWGKLAARYANEEWIGAYDVINEPNWGFENATDKNGCAEKNNEPLMQLLKEITAAIRKADKQHIVIIEGNCWGNNYENMFPLWDDNMLISFHKYWNYTDQHSIQKFLDYRDRYNIPVWMGESGENSNVWFTDAIQLLEENKIGWAWWPLKKAGINNPLQVKLNEGYKKIIAYWKGEGGKPTEAAASEAFMQLAADVKISNNIVHHDVVDAMIRQVKSVSLSPYHDNILPKSTVLFATDFDLGRIHHAYYDIDSGNYWVSTNKRSDWNKGWEYRNDGVDIETCTDSLTNGYSVGWTEDGEWLHYTVMAQTGGTYNITLRYASPVKEGKAQFMINNIPSAMIGLEVTGSYTSWQTSATVPVKFEKGSNSIKLYIHKGGFNLNYIQFVYQDNTANINNR